MAKLGYARVSTEQQDLAAQLEALEAAGCERVFSGKQSGKSDDNASKLKELIDYAREGDKIYLTKLDRMGRSLNQILITIQELQNKGVNVITLDGQVDTTSNNPMQKAMTQLLGVFAELEHSIIVDRLQSGRYRTGKLGGRNPKLSPVQIAEVKKSLSKGESKSALAKRFLVSRSTILNIEKA
jgi:DNA invertase Pin-like site-specific DNA recombinase